MKSARENEKRTDERRAQGMMTDETMESARANEKRKGE